MGLIGSALGAAGAIFGGISANKAMRRARRGIEEQREKNQNWFDRNYYEDSTQRADAQEWINRIEENILKRNRAAAGTAAVMGGTDESVAAAKAANNEALADVTAQIAARGEARKDNIEATYMQNDNAYQEQLNNLEAGKAQAIGSAVGGLASAAGGMEFGTIKRKNGKEVTL